MTDKTPAKREDILRTVAHHSLTDVLYDSLADFAKSESGQAFRSRAQYYADKYGVFKITEAEIEYMVDAIRDANKADIEFEVTIKFLTKAPKS